MGRDVNHRPVVDPVLASNRRKRRWGWSKHVLRTATCALHSSMLLMAAVLTATDLVTTPCVHVDLHLCGSPVALVSDLQAKVLLSQSAIPDIFTH
eukprot:419920-Amphidinium_carterae.4